VVTIDPTTARDFDDAISLEKLSNGNWLLGVHIADVSHFVPRKSPLDEEAYQRGTSVYLPDRVIPMLPEVISNNLASLQPHRMRYTVTVTIEMDESGMPLHTALHRGVIKSSQRFTYEEVDDYLGSPEPWRARLTEPVFQLVRNMHTLAMKLRHRRMMGGAINLVLPEVRIHLDDDGKVCGAYTEENTESHQVIEEFMLAANIAVAQWLDDKGLHLLRRIHATPSESKMAELSSFIHGLGITRENLQDRFALKRVVEQSEDSPQQHAIHYAVLRSMQKAVYSPEDVGHYALNADIYCHFTSPIRRYPDLVIHRMVGDLLDNRKPDADFNRLALTGKHCSNMEKRAAEAERELVKLKLLNFLFDKVGLKMHARVTGVEAFGIFAQGVEIPAEGLIPLAQLPDDNYQYDRAARSLSGFKKANQFQLGDLIEVEVALVNPDRRILEFRLVGINPVPKHAIRPGQQIRFSTPPAIAKEFDSPKRKRSVKKQFDKSSQTPRKKKKFRRDVSGPEEREPSAADRGKPRSKKAPTAKKNNVKPKRSAPKTSRSTKKRRRK
jgi:ribonuclease R